MGRKRGVSQLLLSSDGTFRDEPIWIGNRCRPDDMDRG
jgi:hypothetical protein